MQRREVLILLGATSLSSLLAPLSALERAELGESLHARLGGALQGRALNEAQMAQVLALADAILPATDTPGAVEVGAPAFVDLLLAEWYPEAERRQLLTGLDALEARCREAHGKPFAELDREGRETFLRTVDGRRGDPGSAEDSYSRIKDSLVFGFLTAKPIAERTRTTPIIPGRFDGCIPLRVPS